MRILCDAMLAELARWLRCAGYDTAVVAPHEPDRAILTCCLAEGRTLFTRDRPLARLARHPKWNVAVTLVENEPLDVLAPILSAAHGIDWSRAPFTRCVVDNALLESASEQDCARIPPQAREMPGPFRVCPACQRVYWPGGHVRRMQARLAQWRQLAISRAIKP